MLAPHAPSASASASASAPSFTPPEHWPSDVPVLIAGGGPVGLTAAALLARQCVASLVVEADDGYCAGSRAICISRRSQEILGWAGAGDAMAQAALPWTGGRSYWRSAEVLHFQMPHETTQRFAPMVNIQQYLIEQAIHEALDPALAQVAWSSRVTGLSQQADGVEVQIESAGRTHTVRADYVLACDGGRSTVRECLGLQLQGMQYEGRYVIVDIVQKTRRPVERLAWFDPPSNPGSTLLMHRQPGDVWRIDYQVRDGEDPAEAVKPENVLPRVQSHLDMIGETEPWTPLWISIYNAKCLTLERYRHGRVLFAGDAAHLVPIFGVRGLNSGLDDAANLAWKLAWVLQGRAGDDLLESYSTERVHATHDNLAYGAKSTEFMAPPHFGFKLMREATLRLALHDPLVRPLINPRQSAPVRYPLKGASTQQSGHWTHDLAGPGAPVPELLLQGEGGRFHLSQRLGGTQALCLAMYEAGDSAATALIQALAASLHEHGIALLPLPPAADPLGQARERLGLPTEPGACGLVLLRPDGYVLGRWRGLDPAPLLAAIDEQGWMT